MEVYGRLQRQSWARWRAKVPDLLSLLDESIPVSRPSSGCLFREQARCVYFEIAVRCCLLFGLLLLALLIHVSSIRVPSVGVAGAVVGFHFKTNEDRLWFFDEASLPRASFRFVVLSTQDFYMEMHWSFECSNVLAPIVKAVAPHDHYRIWKKGSWLRMDSTITGT